MDTTQTISVIKEQVLQEQGATTLTEALRNVPGAGTFYAGENGNTSTGDAIYMRGFDTSNSIYVDGVRDVGSISRDVFNTEQVEVTKGPASTDYGRSAPTGAINMVTKQPSLADSFGASLGAGSGSYKRSTVDWNKSLTGMGGAAFRLNAMVQDAGVAGRDRVANDRWGIAPSFAFGLNTDTRTYLNVLHVKQSNVPDGGVPTIGLPGYSNTDARLNAGRPWTPAALRHQRRPRRRDGRHGHAARGARLHARHHAAQHHALGPHQAGLPAHGLHDAVQQQQQQSRRLDRVTQPADLQEPGQRHRHQPDQPDDQAGDGQRAARAEHRGGDHARKAEQLRHGHHGRLAQCQPL